MTLKSDCIVRVATVSNSFDFGATQSLLEAHGIVVVATPVHMLNNFPHYATALKGASIYVRQEQAESALELLEALGWADISPPRRGVFKPILVCMLFVVLAGFAVAPPSQTRLLHRIAIGRTGPIGQPA